MVAQLVRPLFKEVKGPEFDSRWGGKFIIYFLTSKSSDATFVYTHSKIYACVDQLVKFSEAELLLFYQLFLIT